MGFFDWLFNKQKTARPQVTSPKGNTVDVDDFLLLVSSIGYYGRYSLSKSKKWAISWRDSAPGANGGGSRENGLGEFLLTDLERDVVAFQGRRPRPNNGAVADNGSFSLEDWHFGNTLSGTFNVFHADGRSIITKELTANILESGISKNGRLAFCITANSSTEDGHKLFLFDLSVGLELFSVTPQRFRVDGYTFDEKKIELIAKISGGGEYRYGAAGGIIDAEKVDDAYLHSSDYSAIILTAQKLLAEQTLSSGKACEVLVAVIRARALGADTNPAWRPAALKVQGLAHELQGEYREAIALYEEALSLNPKIGVKRKLDSLRKKLD